jgi:hypothetical protein
MSWDELLPQHVEYLTERAVTPGVAAARGYRSATQKTTLAGLGFGINQRRVPALIIPIWPPWPASEPALYQTRPDEPRRNATGKELKFEFPARASVGIDVNPSMLEHVGNPHVPLLVTEGIVKADAVVSRLGVCVAGIGGVWSWRSTNDHDGKVASADWENVALNDRDVLLVFDSDVMLKESVAAALERLGAFLHHRGAHVAYCYLAAGDAGVKVGVDDWLAVDPGRQWTDLTALCRDRPLRAESGVTAVPYEPPPARTLAEVVTVFRRWLKLDDLDPVYAVLGTYAAHRLDGDPVWLMVVGGSGRGKTEIITSLTGLPDVRCAASLTEAALLSGTSSKERAVGAKGGLLAEIGEHGLLVLKDFTSIISMNRDSRAATLAALREVYDGRWDRSVGTDGGRTLSWAGKLGVVAGCTTVIDRAHAVTAAMGERFLTVRISADIDGDELARTALAHAGHEQQMRAELSEAVAGLFGAESMPAHALGSGTTDRLVALVRLVAQARSPVERDYQGEVDLVLDPEAPTRIAKSAERLYAALGTIGLDAESSWRVASRVVLDSVPKLRRAAIRALADGGQHKTNVVAQAVAHPTKTVKRTLEDLEAHGVVLRQAGGEGRADLWSLAPWALTALSCAVPTEPETSEGRKGSGVCVSGDDNTLINLSPKLTNKTGSVTPAADEPYDEVF